MFRLAFLLICTCAVPTAAQVVQLPSIHTFETQTTVVVPDNGSAYLGAVGRATQSRTARGPGWSPLAPPAGTVMGSGAMVHATIIDHSELDEAVLAEARAIREARGETIVDPVAPRVANPSDARAGGSVAAIKREVAKAELAAETEAYEDFTRAREYEARGDLSLARNYYRVAARKSRGDVREQALQRLAALPTLSKSRK